MPSTGPAAEAARAAFRERLAATGHTVENVRAATTALESALAQGVLVRTPALDLMLGDLAVALSAGEGGPLGGKSADAARRIGAAIARELERA